ncbi:uncharacterized protein LOC127239854 isoform X2 [Andrographis paniculata]|uniref:uncharacterized protein LOC127239854 isoform X2 n=1 Tax=Andrographis paniculata TaxID=175694 RepID=UPI0021E8D652|nr:uncharacterized protein LOC127239854 isoform X2 [Andrographis paniculata]
MPPKSASAVPTGRASRLTARKRIPSHSSVVRARAGSSPSASGGGSSASMAKGNRLPLTDVPASFECSKETDRDGASDTVVGAGESPRAGTPVSEAQSVGLKKTLATVSEAVKLDTEGVKCDRAEKLGNLIKPANSGGEYLASDKILPDRDTVDSPSTAKAGNGKKKVVRKTVRIVKKIIKKRVPKKILASDSKDLGTSEKAQDGLNLIDQTLSSNIGNGEGRGTEARNLGCLSHVDVENCNKVMEEGRITAKGTQELKLVGSDGEKGNDQSGIDSVNGESLEFQSSANVSDRMMDEGCTNRHGGDAACSDVQGSEVENSIQEGTVNHTVETVTSLKEMKDSSPENRASVSVVQTLTVDIVDKVDGRLIEHQDVRLEGENNEVLAVGENERKIEEPEDDCGEMKHDSVKFPELPIKEMEASEEKKWQETEIFVGGLDEYTNEDDIRKVFDEVGKIQGVRLAMRGNAGKNKGFAFVHFVTVSDAKKALESYSKVEIRGKQCSVVRVEPNDTIFLGNIAKNWKTNNVLKFLKSVGIEKICKVILKTDPKKSQKNRGFAFVEFETCRDAQIALHKLQKKDAFGRDPRVTAEWARPLVDPNEEVDEVKTVYAECLPFAWDQEKVKEYFKRFGEIENVTSGKGLPSSRRQDSAVIRYKTRDAAFACIEAINREILEDGGSKVKIAVSLAKSIPKCKQTNTSDLTSKQPFKAKPKGSQTSKRFHEPQKTGDPARSSHHNIKFDSRPSTTDELVQLLREQASSNQVLQYPRTGPTVPDYHFPLPGSKRPYSLTTSYQTAHDPFYSECRPPPQMRIGSSYPISAMSSSSYGYDQPPFLYHQERPGFTSEYVGGRRYYPDDFQATQQLLPPPPPPPPYHGHSDNTYRRY